VDKYSDLCNIFDEACLEIIEDYLYIRFMNDGFFILIAYSIAMTYTFLSDISIFSS